MAGRDLLAGMMEPLRGHLVAGPIADPRPGAERLTRGVRVVSAERGLVLGAQDLRVAVDAVRENTWGLGPLQSWVDDPTVTDVLVNGGGRIWVDRGQGPVEVGAVIDGEPGVRALAVRLASLAGRRLDESMPWVDSRLPGGVRLHAVVPPVSPEGTHISLRALKAGPPDLEALVAAGSVPPVWAPVLSALVGARAAFLVTGGTGAGKTTHALWHSLES